MRWFLLLSHATLTLLPQAGAWHSFVAQSPPVHARRVVLSGSSRYDDGSRYKKPKSRANKGRGHNGWWMPPTVEPTPPSLSQQMLVRFEWSKLVLWFSYRLAREPTP